MNDLAISPGERLAIAIQGVTPDSYRQMRASDRVLQSQEGAQFHRELAKIAHAAWEADGSADSPEGILFRKLAHAEVWHEEFNRFTEPVLRAIGRISQRETKDLLEKEATAAALLPVMASEKSGVPSVVKLLLGLGAVGGAGAGSLAFLLSRNARQSSAENAELLQKARAYKQLRREVQEDMALNDAMTESAPAPSRSRYAL